MQSRVIVLHKTGTQKSPFSAGQGRYGGEGDRKKSIQGFLNKANYKLF